MCCGFTTTLLTSSIPTPPALSTSLTDAGGQPSSPGRRRRTAQGKYFMVPFMCNTISNENPLREILVTGISLKTLVTISINKSNFQKTVTVRKGETVTTELPKHDEIKGTGTSPFSTIIKATADITVMSRNFKGTSGDVALMYPVDQCGNDHYIVTPFTGPSEHFTEFSVLAQDIPTTVTVHLGGPTQFNGKNYKKGDTMSVNLEPHQLIQIQSIDDLSGTRVSSQIPVNVVSGHSCAPSNGGCSHVYEQIQPIQRWGRSHLVPSLPYQLTSDIGYVFSSKSTFLEYQSVGEINSVPQGKQLSSSNPMRDKSKRDLSARMDVYDFLQSGGQKQKIKLEAGKLMKMKISASSSTSIHSIQRIQVLRFVTGGEFQGNFLTNIPDIESFSLTYNLIGQEGFDTNLAVIIAKTKSGPGITHNGRVLQNMTWKEIPQSGYSYALYDYGGGFSSNIVNHPTTPFGLLTIGYSKNKAYGTVAPGIQVWALASSSDRILRHRRRVRL
ncbi:IgGFc-binding protein-like [Leptodactylus fuscus]